MVAKAVMEDFAERILLYQNRLWSIAFAFCRNQEEAAEVVQEALLSAWKTRESLKESEKLEPWLCRIVTNQARMRLRSRKRKPTVALEEVGLQFDETGHMVGELPPWKKLPDSLLERKELVKMLLEAAEGLPEGYREVWVLVDQEELAMQEVGEILGLSVGNVKTRLHRARMMLREVLVEKLGGRR